MIEAGVESEQPQGGRQCWIDQAHATMNGHRGQDTLDPKWMRDAKETVSFISAVSQYLGSPLARPGVGGSFREMEHIARSRDPHHDMQET